MPPDVDKPLAFAMNYMQAFSVALHILKRYLAHAELPGGFIHGLMLNVLIWVSMYSKIMPIERVNRR